MRPGSLTSWNDSAAPSEGEAELPNEPKVASSAERTQFCRPNPKWLLLPNEPNSADRTQSGFFCRTNPILPTEPKVVFCRTNPIAFCRTNPKWLVLPNEPKVASSAERTQSRSAERTQVASSAERTQSRSAERTQSGFFCRPNPSGFSADRTQSGFFCRTNPIAFCRPNPKWLLLPNEPDSADRTQSGFLCRTNPRTLHDPLRRLFGVSKTTQSVEDGIPTRERGNEYTTVHGPRSTVLGPRSTVQCRTNCHAAAVPPARRSQSRRVVYNHYPNRSDAHL